MVVQSLGPALSDPRDRSTPGTVLHHLPVFSHPKSFPGISELVSNEPGVLIPYFKSFSYSLPLVVGPFLFLKPISMSGEEQEKAHTREYISGVVGSEGDL